MRRKMKSFMEGYLTIWIEGYSCERFFNLCVYHDLLLWNLKLKENGFEASMRLRDFFKIRPLVKKCKIKVKVKRRCGVPFIWKKYQKRSICLLGIICFFFLFIWLDSRIWRIETDGNYKISEEQIFEYLNHMGVAPGVAKNNISCEEISFGLRDSFELLSWTSVNIAGTCLYISVKEGVEDEPAKDSVAEESPCDITAGVSGTIRSIMVRAGRPIVEQGEKVQAGDVLVTGSIPVLDDNGETKSWLYVHADADIVIEYPMNYQNRVSLYNKKKQYTGKKEKIRIIWFGRHPFVLPHIKKQMNESKQLSFLSQLKLGKHFYLPLRIQTIVSYEYQVEPIFIGKERARKVLQSDFLYFQKKLQEKGVQIFENDVKIKWNEKSAITTGRMIVGDSMVRYEPIELTEEEK